MKVLTTAPYLYDPELSARALSYRPINNLSQDAVAFSYVNTDLHETKNNNVKKIEAVSEMT
jgi:hypothetical protein